jgi:flagellar L-ring protein precursor FlgH
MPANIISLPRIAALALLLACSAFASPLHLPKQHPKTPEQLREDYIARLQQQYQPAADPNSVGSLWSAQSPLGDFSVDYRARNLNDTINITVSVSTTASQSGSANSARSFSTSSAVTGIMGRTPSALNPLIAGNSSQTLKGSGSTASNTAFSTSLTGQVIAVFPNGNLVVQAERQIYMNNQHENVIVRGMIRPGDISSSNSVASSALSNLEIEMKGKGIISDGVRPLNPLTRAVLWILNF